MIEYGTVQKVKGDRAKVVIRRHEMCANCRACEMGTSDKTMTAQARNKAQAKVGDDVAIEMELASLMKASGIAYGAPLIGFFVGVFLGYYALAPGLGWNPPLAGLGLGLLLTFGVYGVIKWLDRRGVFGRGEYEPVVTAVLDPANNPLKQGSAPVKE
jgi:sigma-E factor negative regulatory protein RseC